MKKLVSTGRLFAFGLLVVALLALCVGTLYKLQIIEGAAYYEESQNKQVSEQTVTAARGNILDRYGRVLVSNRECYNLKISDKRLFSDEVEDPNAVILQMINMVEAAGDKYTDDLPITKEPPFEYTNMTDIQRMLLNAYLKDKGLDEDTTAVELMSYFRTRYDIAGSYNAEEMRKIASVRYAVNVRYAINTNPYVFVEDASIDLISDLMGVVGNVVEVETSYIREYNTQYAWATSRPCPTRIWKNTAPARKTVPTTTTPRSARTALSSPLRTGCTARTARPQSSGPPPAP